MSNIPEWYDSDTKSWRSDIWPFQKVNKIDAKWIAKERLRLGIMAGLKKLPDGWSVQWNASRKRKFRLNHSIRKVAMPFPKNRAGFACFNSAMWLLTNIRNAVIYSDGSGIPPAYQVKSWEHPWLVGGGSRVSVNPGYAAQLNYGCYGGYLSVSNKAWRQASLNTSHEVLRWMSSPEAWNVPRKKKGSPRRWSEHLHDARLLEAIAYRKALMDYIKVNERQYPLPSKAAAKLKKIQSTQDPLSQP